MEMQAKARSESSKLIEAEALIWNHLFGFINSMSLKCAVQLNIPDIIHDHGAPMCLSDLVNALQINPSKSNCVYRLMRILTHSRVFLKQKISENGVEEGYVLTSSSRLLLKNEPLSDRSLVLAMLDPVLINPWFYLSKWFESDSHSTAFDAAHGQPFWEHARLEKRFGQLFNDGMGNDARLITTLLIEECSGVFKEVKSVVDVGGGTGTVAAMIADAFPNLECINFDLPHVVDGLEGSKNMRHVGGDMFEAVPPAAVVLLKWILHDWNDEECLTILKRCKDAIESKEKGGGKVIVIEMVVNADEQKASETHLRFDMLMMANCTGKERDEKEWANLFRLAGFTRYTITPAALGSRSLIQLYP